MILTKWDVEQVASLLEATNAQTYLNVKDIIEAGVKDGIMHCLITTSSNIVRALNGVLAYALVPSKLFSLSFCLTFLTLLSSTRAKMRSTPSPIHFNSKRLFCLYVEQHELPCRYIPMWNMSAETCCKMPFSVLAQTIPVIANQCWWSLPVELLHYTSNTEVLHLV